MVNFKPTEEQQLIRETMAGFAREVLRPGAREADEKGDVPEDVVARGWELGLVQSAIPEAVRRLRRRALGRHRRAPARGAGVRRPGHRPPAAGAAAGHHPARRARHRRRSSAQWLPRFAGDQFAPAPAAFIEPRWDFDPTALATRAERQGGDCVLPGRSASCRSPTAGGGDPGVRATAERARPRSSSSRRGGLKVGEREQNMGIKALATFPVPSTACACRRPAGSAATARTSQPLIDASRVAVRGAAVGVARAAFDYARDYAKERRAFGVAIAQKQAIAFMLAEMAIEIDAMRLLAWEAAWKLDRGEAATREAYLAKHYAADVGPPVTDNARPGARRARLHPRPPRRAAGCATPAASRPSMAWRSSEGATTMIDFELSDEIKTARGTWCTPSPSRRCARSRASTTSSEHEKPWDFINMMWQVSSGNPIGGAGARSRRRTQGSPERNLGMCVSIEELSWGDAGLYLSIPNAGLGGAAVAAAGTPEQKERFLARFKGGKPKWAAMAITEPRLRLGHARPSRRPPSATATTGC